MSAGFNTLSIAHRIDEFVFDCSFDSLAQANALEPEMSALLTAKLLPVIDSILNEFDQAGTVWRLDQVEIDLGDIASEDFDAELMQRVQDKLRERLSRLQDHHQSLDAAPAGIPPTRRLSKIQTDLETLQDFLLTGRMPWPVDAADRHAHENLLRQILQQHDARAAWFSLLKRLPSAQRTVAIGRLVAQFSHRSLESVLAGIAPADAHPLLDFLHIYQQAMSEVDAKAVAQTERIRPGWAQLFEMLLESKPLPGNWTILLDQLIKTIMLRHAQESSQVLQSIRQAAKQFHEEGKISGAFYTALQTLSSLYLGHPQHASMGQSASLEHRNGSHDAASRAKETKNNEKEKRETPPETAASPGREKQADVVYEALYVRIGDALQKAGLIDAGFASLLMGLPPVERQQRLRSLLQSPAVKPRLPRLPQAVLLDISYLLSPQASLLMERLLTHASRLYQQPGMSGRTTQKHWKQQRWSAVLDYLLRKADSSDAIDPAGFMRALAHGVHGETAKSAKSAKSAEAHITLRAWHEALVNSEPYSVIAMLLRTLIDEAPEQNKQAENSTAQNGKSPGQNSPQQPLHNRLTAGKAVSRQQDLATLLQTLATGTPEQLHQLYRDLRNGRYDLTAVQLDATGFYSLIEKLLHIQSSTAGADQSVFLQAIAAQADRVDDQATYYRLILENLLQEREIDLEAIAALAQQPHNRTQEEREYLSKQAAAEETEETKETETGDEVALQARQIHTGLAALFLRITAALREAGLAGEHAAITVTDTNPDELKQRLRAILREIETDGWVEKLPQASRMDIAYLLSPQAALLNEHLLVLADKLQRSTAMSVGSSRKQWEQRLWEASLNYLLAKTERDIASAVYLQALARGVSDQADSRATLHAWYKALEQSKAFGTVHTVLQNFFSGTREKDQASEALRTSIQLETANLPEREKQAGAVYEELTARIVEALQKAGLIDASFASKLMGLAPVEQRQRLHSLLQSPAVKPRLPQLRQSILLNISYWLSPPAALLNEHLLAHTDKLQRTTAKSTGGGRKQWEQRLWEASLNYLLTEAESAITPADYLQTLARGVSDQADPKETLHAWYEALERSKTSGAVHNVLHTFFSGTQEKDRASAVQSTSVQPETVTKTGELEDTGPLKTTTSPGWEKQAGVTYEALYVRIGDALQKARLIDAGFAAMLMGLAPVDRRQRLRSLLQLAAVKPRLPRLPQAVLLDIGYWLSPQAALLMERLLAHASRLYQQPGMSGRTTQKHWKQQRWSTALDFLLREADSSDAIDPAGFLRALAQGVYGEAAESAKAHITLRAWYEALVYSEPYSVIAMLLRTLIDEAPEQNKPAEENAMQSGKLPEENTLQQPLHKHLTAGKAIPGQQDLTTLLEALATGHPEQLRQLYRDLRDSRYDLTAAQLNATDLHSLIKKLLHIQSSTAGADKSVFLQAIEVQADRADDQAIYYRLILENLLREREIDLEAIAALAQQPRNRTREDRADRIRQATAGETKETKGTETGDEAALQTVADSTRPIYTGVAALYSRITAALRKAGLTGEHSAITATDTNPDELRQRLRAILREIETDGWVKKLPQASRMDIAYLLSPQAALLNEHLLAHADKLQRSTALRAGGGRKQWEQRLWEASLNYLLTETESEIAPADYVQALARGVTDQADPREALRAWYAALEQSRTSAAIRTLLQIIAEASVVPLRMDGEDNENPDSSRSVAGAEGNAPSAEKPPLLDWDALLNRAQSADDVREEIYIENAGQVLAAPYLPRLFNMLKLVEDGAFVDRHAAERAVHLMQFMVNEQTRSPEFQLTLNKILCGVKTGIPICREIDISAHEQEMIEGLIRGMIQNWKTIGNTSISGLRETFLQRKGRLQLKEDGMWYLTVEPGVFDMLLDSLPWSFSVIKHSWMERAVHVTWR